MSDERIKWEYRDETGAIHVDEPVTIQGRVWAAAASASNVRDPNGRTDSQPRTDGWTSEEPFGDEHNYIWKTTTSLLSDIEPRGVLPWSAITNYTRGGLTFASDNEIYIALQASGPDEGVGVRDPILDTAGLYWLSMLYNRENFISGFVVNRISDSELQFLQGSCTAKNFPRLLRTRVPINRTINGYFGDGNGGIFDAVPFSEPNYTYHAFIIRNDSTGLCDIGFDNDPNAVHIPAGYTAYRRISSHHTDASGDFFDFVSHEIEGGALRVEFSGFWGTPGEFDLGDVAFTVADLYISDTPLSAGGQFYVPLGLNYEIGTLGTYNVRSSGSNAGALWSFYPNYLRGAGQISGGGTTLRKASLYTFATGIAGAEATNTFETSVLVSSGGIITAEFNYITSNTSSLGGAYQGWIDHRNNRT